MYRGGFSPKINLSVNLNYREDESKPYRYLFPFMKEDRKDAYLMGLYKAANGIVDFSVVPAMLRAKINAYRRYELYQPPNTLRMEFRCYLTRKGQTGVIDKVECCVIKRGYTSAGDVVIWQRSYKVEQNQTDSNKTKKLLQTEFIKIAEEFTADIKNIRKIEM